MTESESEKESSPPSGREEAEAQIFLCDPSAEAGRLLNSLQAKGFVVVDVPLGLLANRTRHEVPKLIICDADAREAYPRIKETLESAPDWMKVMLIGHRDGALSSKKELHTLATITMFRPLDVEATGRTISDLIGTPAKVRSHRPRQSRGVRAPRLVASARKPYRSDGRKSSPQASLIPQIIGVSESSLAGARSPSMLSSDPGPLADGRLSAGTLPPPTPTGRNLSPETAAILEEGRRRMGAFPEEPPRPVRLPFVAGSGGEHVRGDFLAALTEPLGDAMDHAPGVALTTSRPETATGTNITRAQGESFPGSPRSRQQQSAEELTNPGGRPLSRPPSAGTPTGFDSSPPPLLDDLSDLLDGPDPPDVVTGPREDSAAHRVTTAPPLNRVSRRVNAPTFAPSRAPQGLPSLGPAGTSAVPFHTMPASLPAFSRDGRPGIPRRGSEHAPFVSVTPPSSDEDFDSLAAAAPPNFSAPMQDLPLVDATASSSPHEGQFSRLLAHAISERRSGAVAQQEEEGVRRIVILDGDISTVSSSLESESLPYFLFERGDYTESVLDGLGPVPAFGRHAGAALVARGLLQQEDLWPVLRAHAEWVLGIALTSTEPAQFEDTVPARLREEPAVFGGAAGTEIFVEAIRRIVSPEDAFTLLGAGQRLLGIGPHEELIRESALSLEHQSEVLAAVGVPLSGLAATRPHLLPILLALVELGVLTAGGGVSMPQPKLQEKSREMDDQAFAQRLIARKALVEDGDYFSILGVSRNATRYEVDRAHEELHQEYTETRLTPRTLHLKDDLRMVLDTIDEAHMVLRDDVRRHRYRGALEATPG